MQLHFKEQLPKRISISGRSLTLKPGINDVSNQVLSSSLIKLGLCTPVV